MKIDNVDVKVDATGLACPMPLVRAKKTIDGMQSGQIMELLTTDKGSVNDFTSWVKRTDHELLHHEEENDIFKFYVKKA